MTSDRYLTLFAGIVLGALGGLLVGSLWAGTAIMSNADAAATEQLCRPKCVQGASPRAELRGKKFVCICTTHIEVEGTP